MYRAVKPSDVDPSPLQLGGVQDVPKDELDKITEAVAELGNRDVRAALGSFVPALSDAVKGAVANEKSSAQFNDLLSILFVLHEIGVSASQILLLDGRDEQVTAARSVSLPKESFVHGKLTGKLTRQLQDTITLCSSTTPTWCTALASTCPWLFPFELRLKMFKCVSFSLSRMLHHLHGDGSDAGAVTTDGGREIRIGRLQRQKVRVNRNQIFESARKVFDIPNTLKMVLEVEFFEEVGTGTGPTLEFFTLLSKQFKRRKLQLWRDSGIANEEDLVVAPHGLFPAPMAAPRMSGKTHASRIKNFKLLGQAIGKVLQDGRMLDLPLAPAFYRALLGRCLGLRDLIEIDPGLGNTLRRLDAAANEIENMKRQGLPESAWKQVTVDGANIEDLCLTFVVPGSSVDLVKGGSDIVVNEVNLREYVDAVVEACVGSGVASYFESIQAGLEEVCPVARLRMFDEAELDTLICGQGEAWTPELLTDCITFDHGYNAQSPPIKNFCDILSSFTPEQQRAFMRFVTGAPRLPPGGLAALQPRLTVVCKQPSPAVGSSSDSVNLSAGTPLADGDLPSAMTCASYLKLPPYSCKEVMAERLRYAMCEGQGSFDLS
jgi:E3 ubiquitin-protein ligase TRIP12